MPDTAVLTDIAGWSGLILPYGVHKVVGDSRVVHPTTYELARELPIPVTFQEKRQPNHTGAVQGLATITRVWQTDEGLYASGTFDMDDPRAAELARKIDRGFLGWGSADIETDGGHWEKLSSGHRVPAYRTWRLTGYTLVPDSAFAESRIQVVRDPSQITTVDQLRGATVTFASAMPEFTERLTFAAGTVEPAPIERKEPMADEPADTETTETETTNETATTVTFAAETIEQFVAAVVPAITDAVTANLDARAQATEAEQQRTSAVRAKFAALRDTGVIGSGRGV